jgi:hypothetical protein
MSCGGALSGAGPTHPSTPRARGAACATSAPGSPPRIRRHRRRPGAMEDLLCGSDLDTTAAPSAEPARNLRAGAPPLRNVISPEMRRRAHRRRYARPCRMSWSSALPYRSDLLGAGKPRSAGLADWVSCMWLDQLATPGQVRPGAIERMLSAVTSVSLPRVDLSPSVSRTVNLAGRGRAAVRGMPLAGFARAGRP